MLIAFAHHSSFMIAQTFILDPSLNKWPFPGELCLLFIHYEKWGCCGNPPNFSILTVNFDKLMHLIIKEKDCNKNTQCAPDGQKSTGYLSTENFLTVFLHMSPLFLYPTYHTFNDGFSAITRYERRFFTNGSNI